MYSSGMKGQTNPSTTGWVQVKVGESNLKEKTVQKIHLINICWESLLVWHCARYKYNDEQQQKTSIKVTNSASSETYNPNQREKYYERITCDVRTSNQAVLIQSMESGRGISAKIQLRFKGRL